MIKSIRYRGLAGRYLDFEWPKRTEKDVLDKLGNVNTRHEQDIHENLQRISVVTDGRGKRTMR